MNLTAEDRIMGRKEPTTEDLKVLTFETKYIVCAEGNDNTKVVNGEFVERILSFEAKRELIAGAKEIKINGLVITKVEETKVEEPAKEEVIEEKEELPKPKRRKAK